MEQKVCPLSIQGESLRNCSPLCAFRIDNKCLLVEKLKADIEKSK